MVIDILAEHSLLLLFIVAVVGHVIGKVRVRGISLGVAAVLFVGLAASAFDARLQLPALYSSLGLVIFVYSIGIASGPSFFAALRRHGLRNNIFVAGAIIAAALLVVGIYAIGHIAPAVAAGLFTGTMTNTPSMAGLVQLLSSGSLGDATKNMAGLPAVGYSIAYPLGVLGPIAAIAFWQRRFKIDYKADAHRATDIVAAGEELHNKTVRITNRMYCGIPLKSLAESSMFNVLFARVRRGKQEWLATRDDSTLEHGDLLLIVGTPEDTAAAVKQLGTESKERLNLDHSHYDRHRVFVSSKAVAGCKISELHLPQRFDAMITRVRRGDVDMLAHKNFVLEAGDRVRVVAPVGRADMLRNFFGDSYQAVSSINILAIGTGISAGLVLGLLPIPLPGDMTFRLGEAAGPLLVGLILGALHRSGPIVWGIPYNANLTLREFGLILMLAGIGTRSGQTFIHAMSSSEGLGLFLTAGCISFLVPFVFLPIVYRKFKMPFGVATGMLSALHTQPAALAYATQQAGNDLPGHGYAIVFPTATISKIILSQLLLIALL